jgi:carboxypeptidase family protein
MRLRVVGVAVLLFAPWIARAQGSGSIAVTGAILDENKLPIVGAVVDVLSVGRVRTDSTGAFRLSQVPPGTLIVRATMIGFQPVMKLVTAAAGEELHLGITMLHASQQLATVVVREDSATTLLSDPTGFDGRRRSSNGGHFLVAEEIEKMHVTETEQLFHGIPTAQVDTGGIIVIKRGEISLRDIYLSGKDVNQFNMCIGAQVLLNGVAMPQPFNINTVPLYNIRGIEIYSGPATTPTSLRSPKSVCGTVAIWTKRQ